MSKEAYDKAMEELDQLAKSQDEQKDDLETIDDLTKALEEELGEDLAKSEDDDESAGDDDDDDVEKSDDATYDDELVKASEAYASLEKSVMEGMGELGGELDTMRKSMAALMNLTIKQAKVIAGQAKANDQLVKSVEDLAKSVQALGAQPVGASKTVLGVGSVADEEPVKKSHSEIQDALIKAIDEGKIAAQCLSIYGTYKDINKLPKEARTAIGM
jgi:Mg2+ and Co2+ transporter CorA